MRRVVPVVVGAVVLLGAALVYLSRGMAEDAAPSASARPVSAAPEELPAATASERFERSIHARAASRRSLGEFRLSGGRSVRLYSVDTTDGKSCLVDEDPRVGPSAGCLEDGLFGVRKAAFSVNTTGGPGRYDELYLIGVAAPGVRAVDVVKTDGSSVRVGLDADRAFLFESSASELAARIHPSSLRLYGPGGRLIETVGFPPAG